MSNKFSERLEEIAQMYGGIPVLSVKSGCSDAVIRKWIRGDSLPTVDRLVALAKTTGVSIEWLATGEGPRQPGGGEGDNKTKGDYIYVPRFDVVASAGEGVAVGGESVTDYRPFKAADLRRLGPTNSLTIIEVRGESMIPTLSPGDEVLLDMSNLNGAYPDGIYAVRVNDTLLIKRIQQLPGGRVVISSDNPIYKPFEINLGQEPEGFWVLGRAVWCGKRL